MASAQQPRKRVVLLVDDDAAVRTVARRCLQTAGYDVVEAGDGLRAWTQFQRQPNGFDVLLADVVMPRMPGTEVAVRVHDVRPELPVVLMTGYTPEGPTGPRARRSHGLAADRTVSPETLLGAVGKALGT